MTFTSPTALLALLLLPIGAAGYVALARRRAAGSTVFASPALQPGLVTGRPGWRRLVPVVLAFAALALLLVGAARPNVVWTFSREEATVVLAVDTSLSMTAKDVAPTRLDAARVAIDQLLDTAPDHVKVSIVAFATSAQTVLPPTLDREAARVAVRELSLGTGTGIGEAIVTSLSVAGGAQRAGTQAAERAPSAIVLLSDGAQTTEGANPLQAAARARALGVPVNTVALGARDATVEVPLAGGVIERVNVAPDIPTLRRIAQTSGGTFSQALTARQLTSIYSDLGRRLAQEEKKVEVTSAFGAGGAVLLLLAGGLSTAWFRRAL
jgi:Ca-activated chloride channel family protein